MRLDSARNHLMLLNLWLSMVSISLTVTTILPSAYGMNIEHGMEGALWFFYAVGGFSLLGECVRGRGRCNCYMQSGASVCYSP